MVNKNLNKHADRLVNAFLKNKIIAAIPSRYTKKLTKAQSLRKLCESKISKPIAGFKAAGTGIPMLKKLKENTLNKNHELDLLYRRWSVEDNTCRFLIEQNIKAIDRGPSSYLDA